MRVEPAEARAAVTTANLRAELAQAHRDLAHLARLHLATIAYCAPDEHYPELVTTARGARARLRLGALLAERVTAPDVISKRPVRRRG